MRFENIGKSRLAGSLLILIAALAIVFAFLFAESFESSKVLRANDGPLGAIKADAHDLPSSFVAVWQDLNWLGAEAPTAPPHFSSALMWLVSPETFLKIYAPISLLLLGISAWFLFRQLRFHPAIAVLGGIAAALNANYFSNACWGQESRPLSLATTFFAIGLIVGGSQRFFWIKTVLAGLLVGLGVMEAFDVGAIFSLYVAAFVVFAAAMFEKAPATKIGKGLLRVGIVAVFAGLIAAQTVVSLIGTQVKGVVGVEQTPEAKAARWDFATQWSTPKAETLRVIIPGLFGYATPTLGEKQYWGKVGQAPGMPASRFNGSGEYAGILVVLLAVFAAAQSFRGTRSPFSIEERKFIWFWSALALVSLLLAFGRYAPFYKIAYALPYFSTIRNPMKFMHPFHMILIILFGYGLQALYRQHIERAASSAESLKTHLARWWATAAAFHKKWTIGSIVVVGISILGWLLYSSSKPALEKHLQSIGFDEQIHGAGYAAAMASFSVQEVGWFVLFLTVTVALVTVVLSGWFSGQRAKWAFVLMGGLLVVDLARANAPWIVYHDIDVKYASNPVIDLFRENQHEKRVVFFPQQHSQSIGFFRNNPELSMFHQLYYVEWLQHHFQYYNIQALDVIQDPRTAAENVAFRMAMQMAPLVRQWELTNTRFIFGLGGNFAEQLNQRLDPAQRRFQLHTAFDVVLKPGREFKSMEDLTAVPNPNGRFGVIEFTGALPRAKLYSNWQVSTDDQEVLDQLRNPSFDPHSTVILSEASPAAPGASSGAETGSVEFASYAPKRIELSVKATSPAVLLLNDKYNPNWKVTIDGQPVELLRANFLMRAVPVPAGEHKLVFEFQPPIRALYISLIGIALGIGLCAFLVVAGSRTIAASHAAVS